jgi:hypothetical protein
MMAARRIRTSIASLAAGVALGAVAVPAAQATDSWPCGSQITKSWSTDKVQLCPLAGALAPNGWVPVYSAPVAVANNQQPPAPIGWMHGIDDKYFVCDRYVANADYNHPTQTWHHRWWAWTHADSPAVWGWVSEVYFKGGNDDEGDAALRDCPPATAAPTPPAQTPATPAPVPTPETPGAFPTPPDVRLPPAADPVLPPADDPTADTTGCEPLPASAAVVLHANVGKARRTRTIAAGNRVAVRGKLIGADGEPVANAPLCVAARPDTVAGATRVLGRTRTNAKGEFTYILAPNTSQQVSVVHRNDTTAASDTVDVRVRIPLTIHTSRRQLRNGQALQMRGLLDAIPDPGGVIVVFEAWRGDRWQLFGSDTSDAHGGFRLTYRFTRTSGVQHYRLRVRVPEQTGFPFAPSASRPITVRVSG